MYRYGCICGCVHVCVCVCVSTDAHTHVFKSPNENIEKMLLDPIVILIVIEAEKLKTL